MESKVALFQSASSSFADQLLTVAKNVRCLCKFLESIADNEQRLSFIEDLVKSYHCDGRLLWRKLKKLEECLSGLLVDSLDLYKLLVRGKGVFSLFGGMHVERERFVNFLEDLVPLIEGLSNDISRPELQNEFSEQSSGSKRKLCERLGEDEKFVRSLLNFIKDSVTLKSYSRDSLGSRRCSRGDDYALAAQGSSGVVRDIFSSRSGEVIVTLPTGSKLISKEVIDLSQVVDSAIHSGRVSSVALFSSVEGKGNSRSLESSPRILSSRPEFLSSVSHDGVGKDLRSGEHSSSRSGKGYSRGSRKDLRTEEHSSGSSRGYSRGSRKDLRTEEHSSGSSRGYSRGSRKDLRTEEHSSGSSRGYSRGSREDLTTGGSGCDRNVPLLLDSGHRGCYPSRGFPPPPRYLGYGFPPPPRYLGYGFPPPPRYLGYGFPPPLRSHSLPDVRQFFSTSHAHLSSDGAVDSLQSSGSEVVSTAVAPSSSVENIKVSQEDRSTAR